MSTNNNLTIGTIIAKTVPFLTEKKVPNPRLEADLLLAGVLNLPRVKLYSEWDRPLEPSEVQQYREVILKRIQGWPLAYISGKKSFLSWDFEVTPEVLIPRPETELLVETAVDLVKGKGAALKGVDVGTGSGIIAISLAKLLPDSQWIAIDLSAAALAVATKNAAALGVADRIQFIQGDLLEPLQSQSSKYDLIVSNPPYIPSREIDTLQAEVRKEPRLALDGGDDGLQIYRRLFPQTATLVADEGLILVEHGYDQRVAIGSLLTEAGFNCRTITDLAGLDRVTIGEPVPNQRISNA